MSPDHVDKKVVVLLEAVLVETTSHNKSSSVPVLFVASLISSATNIHDRLQIHTTGLLAITSYESYKLLLLPLALLTSYQHTSRLFQLICSYFDDFAE